MIQSTLFPSANAGDWDDQGPVWRFNEARERLLRSCWVLHSPGDSRFYSDHYTRTSKKGVKKGRQSTHQIVSPVFNVKVFIGLYMFLAGGKFDLRRTFTVNLLCHPMVNVHGGV